jgi:hypothetical protein
VNVVVYHSWTSSRHWIKDVNTQDNTVHFTNQSGWPIGYWDRSPSRLAPRPARPLRG